jgi:hypothetical protein
MQQQLLHSDPANAKCRHTLLLLLLLLLLVMLTCSTAVAKQQHDNAVRPCSMRHTDPSTVESSSSDTVHHF